VLCAQTFGPKLPGKENNWVQTWPDKGFNVLLRLYSPLEPWFDKTWKPGRDRRDEMPEMSAYGT
jgi:hypothetical protein